MNESFAPAERLYRDIDRRWVAGVLAGAARHFGWSLGALRFVAIILCMTPVVPLVVIAYAIGALVLPPRRTLQSPPPPPGASEWRGYAAPRQSTSPEELRIRIRDMEDRLRSMEAYVTSAQYEIDRELKRRPD
jgi:phage shock protein C